MADDEQHEQDQGDDAVSRKKVGYLGFCEAEHGVLQNGSAYSVNTTTGQVTFNTAPGNGVSVSANFEFDVPVRFDTDQLEINLQDFGVGSWGNIPLVEVRP